MASARDGLTHKRIRHILAVVAIILAQLRAQASVRAQGSFRATNPASSLTLTAGTAPYSAGQLIANSSTGLSVTNPFFVLPPGGGAIARLRLSTNDATSTAWGGQIVQIDLWSASPTWTNGDHGAWAPATGTATHLASFSCDMSPDMATAPMPNARRTSAISANCPARRRYFGACRRSPAPARPMPAGHLR